MLRQRLPHTGPRLFKPGDEVPRSGIYCVFHANQHAKAHEVTCVYRERFPPCTSCAEGVRFALVSGAQHVTSHEHFKRPGSRALLRLIARLAMRSAGIVGQGSSKSS